MTSHPKPPVHEFAGSADTPAAEVPQAAAGTSAQSVPSSADVAIIGMGPVGKLAGLLLARAGHSVVLTERKARNYPLPRAVAMDAEIARILQGTGLRVDSIPDAVEPYDDVYLWVDANDEPMHMGDWSGVDPSGWGNEYFYNQPALESHLDRALLSEPNATVLRGVNARVIDSGAAGSAQVGISPATDATPTSTDPEPAAGRVDAREESTLEVRYVLAADGAGSRTRRDLGLPWNDPGYFFGWLVVDVVPGPDLQITHLAKQVCDPKRPTTVVPGGPGRRRWESMRMDGESKEELVRPEKIWELLAPHGVRPDNAELERGVVYTFNSGWASQRRSGNVLLLGDAAHLMPPFAGQGLAAGFRDAVNLCWKLDLALRGLAGDELLDTYEPERQRHVADFIDFSMSLGRIICVLDETEAAERDAQMKAAIAANAAGEAPPAPRLGDGAHQGETGGVLSLQGRITVSDDNAGAVGDEAPEVRFDDVFGTAALILGDDVEAPGPRTVAELAEVGIRTVRMGEDFRDARGSYREWLDQPQASAALVRPDLYVFGTAAGQRGAEELAQAFLSAVRAGQQPAAVV